MRTTIKAMHNPPHPGEFITKIYLEPNNLSGRELASKLGVSPSTLSRIISGTSHIRPEMALRLSKALGRSPESWLEIINRQWLIRALPPGVRRQPFLEALVKTPRMPLGLSLSLLQTERRRRAICQPGASALARRPWTVPEKTLKP
ncbi:MAG TPA: HigA family addiction module antitoxin [Pyrinomonadaceae bacterium]|nr:HigA family addiction module antitoxin [Pyrinomonadaceae bacterium]